MSNQKSTNNLSLLINDITLNIEKSKLMLIEVADDYFGQTAEAVKDDPSEICNDYDKYSIKTHIAIDYIFEIGKQLTDIEKAIDEMNKLRKQSPANIKE